MNEWSYGNGSSNNGNNDDDNDNDANNDDDDDDCDRSRWRLRLWPWWQGDNDDSVFLAFTKIFFDIHELMPVVVIIIYPASTFEIIAGHMDFAKSFISGFHFTWIVAIVTRPWHVPQGGKLSVESPLWFLPLVGMLLLGDPTLLFSSQPFYYLLPLSVEKWTLFCESFETTICAIFSQDKDGVISTLLSESDKIDRITSSDTFIIDDNS